MAATNRPIKNVVVLGATGNIGSPIVDVLAVGNYSVTAVTRDKSKASFPPQVKIAESDLSTASLRSIFRDQDAVVSCVAGALLTNQKAIIDVAVECGVVRFLPSEYGMDSANPNAAVFLPVIGKKVDVMSYLRTKENEISWSAVIVGSFFDWSLRLPGLMGWDVKNGKATIFDGGDVEFEGTNLPKIGEAVAAMLAPENLTETANQYVYVNSFTTTQNRVLAALEESTGRKFEVTEATTAGLRERALEQIQQNPTAAIDLIVASMYGQGGINLYSKDFKAGLWNERLGLKKETLKETIENEGFGNK